MKKPATHKAERSATQKKSGNSRRVSSNGKSATKHKQAAAAAEQLTIVAIGASAGGLDAITELLKNLPPKTGMAFIYVQHLSPDHKSMLPSLLSSATKMKIREIDNMDKIRPDNVYVIPHNKGIEITDGHIKLIPRRVNNSIHSIDTLFSSLAQAHKEHVIGIILSGSAGDGSRGIKDIKQEGGITFAQNDTAKFGSMPQSAIATGYVDFVLSPREIALELVRLTRHPFVKINNARFSSDDGHHKGDADLQKILEYIQQAVGVDFSLYKMNTIRRRITRRMVFLKVNSFREYRKLLDQKKEETDALYRDLLINVTDFFRDTEAYKFLQATLFPKILKSKKNGEPLRLWVPACSTGEEVFTMAIILLELQSGKSNKVPIQIFGTDISTHAIAKARSGIFSKNDLKRVSPKRIQRYFMKTDVGYRIAKQVRDMCVFAPHNILTDPPFSRLDFISCCNLFIYLDTAAQKKALATFHYALTEGGYLMLGKSETVNASMLFTAENKKLKIFSRKKNNGRQLLASSPEFTQYNSGKENKRQKKLNNRIPAARPTVMESRSFDAVVNDILLSQFIPASVVVNQAMEILQFRGGTSVYLQHPEGRATLNILKMARPEIAFELRNAITKAIKTKERVRKTGIELKGDTELRLLSVEVVPFEMERESLLLILFTAHEHAETSPQVFNKEPGIKSTAKDRRITKLQEELQTVQADALAFAQDQEAFAEELQSANEEVVSSNEELQTMNEELETSKEEIESVNEELRTTNEEMQTRNELLNEAYEYSESIISTIHDAMLILDKDLRVKFANKKFYQKFAVTEADTEGMYLYDLGNGQWKIPALRQFLEEIILKSSSIHDFEVTLNFPDIGKKILLLNANRIIQKAHREQLILLVIEDITGFRLKAEELQRKEKELQDTIIKDHRAENEKLEKAVTERTKELLRLTDALVKSEERYHRMINQVQDYSILFLSKEGIIENWNEGAEKIKGYKEKEIIGKNFRVFYPDADRKAGLPEKLLAQAVQKGNATHEGWRVRKDKTKFWGNTVITALHDDTNNIVGFSKVTRDLTDRKKAEDKIKEANERLIQKNDDLVKMNKELQAFTYISSHDMQEPLRKIRMFAGRILARRDEKLGITTKEDFLRMQDAATRMQALIMDLLSFSRLNSGDRKFQRTSLNSIIEEVKADFIDTITEKHAVITIKGNATGTIIPFQFRQLMQNVIGNALKFTSAGVKPHININVESIDQHKLNIGKPLPQDKYCHISISDNGIGFEPEFSEKIFEVFQKLHDRSVYTGTGIGLAIVKKIVEIHNGIITATSEPGKGAKFDIYLPA